MPRTEVYQLRLTKAEKDLLAEKARECGLSIAGLIRTEVGLSDRAAAIGESQSKGQRLAGDRPSVPIAESDPSKLTKLIKQLEAQGKSPAVATALASRRLSP
jgi:hypothetical protein